MPAHPNPPNFSYFHKFSAEPQALPAQSTNPRAPLAPALVNGLLDLVKYYDVRVFFVLLVPYVLTRNCRIPKQLLPLLRKLSKDLRMKELWGRLWTVYSRQKPSSKTKQTQSVRKHKMSVP